MKLKFLVFRSVPSNSTQRGADLSNEWCSQVSFYNVVRCVCPASGLAAGNCCFPRSTVVFLFFYNARMEHWALYTRQTLPLSYVCGWSILYIFFQKCLQVSVFKNKVLLYSPRSGIHCVDHAGFELTGILLILLPNC